MNKFLTILKMIKDYFLVAVILFLITVLYFKNNKIDKLTTQLGEKPKVEYVYETKTDTIVMLVPKPYIVQKVDTVIKDRVIKEIQLMDSTELIAAYEKLYEDYSNKKLYNQVLKDDTTAYIRLEENVQFNTIQHQKLVFESRMSTKVITDIKEINRFSIVVGATATIGTHSGVGIGGGIVTKKNVVITGSYDPINNQTLINYYTPLFNFKR